MSDDVIRELWEKSMGMYEFTDSPEPTAIINKIEDIIGSDKYLDIEELINAHATECEARGFIGGFKYAMRIMLACGGKEPDTGAAGNS